ATSYTYDGTAKKPTVSTVTVNGTTLKAGTDYTVSSYSNNTNAGTATVTITGKGNYTGTVTETFTIAKASQTITAKAAVSSITAGATTSISVSGAKGTVTYKSGNTSVATVSSSGVVTAKRPGTVTITVTAAATSNYSAASKTVSVKVTLASCKVSSLTNVTKGVTVEWNQVTGASGYYIYRKTDSESYQLIKTVTDNSTVSYTDTAVKSKNCISYTYKVVAYYGSGSSVTKSGFTAKTIVRLKTPTLSRVKNTAPKKVLVTWKKVTKVTGYQIQYSSSSSFSTKKTVKGYSKVRKVLSGLKKGKTWYVRIRTYYKTSSGKTYYSAWTTKKKVAVKR
ncbi:MAG: Ig-like domain-containing protein, partial [Clostridiales bacterium]|nr:Ig-like domain-containing protein [Clostridiales bacterium]